MGWGTAPRNFVWQRSGGIYPPLNSYRTSNQIYVNWSNHFKGLYGTRKIPHLALKMVDKHLCNLYSQNILKHGGNHYSYFDYDKNNRRLDWIKADASVRKERHARQLMEINSDTKARRDAANQAEPDMSV